MDVDPHDEGLQQTAQLKDFQRETTLPFTFGQASRLYLSGSAHVTILQLTAALHNDLAQVKRIRITGHADPLGSPLRNERLGYLRAETVKEMLVDGGIPESLISIDSAGSREPVVPACYGTTQEQVACYAPNRRVTLQVESGAARP